MASYSITSSARSRNDSGICRPIALAVWALTRKSNLVGCSTGKVTGSGTLKNLVDEARCAPVHVLVARPERHQAAGFHQLAVGGHAGQAVFVAKSIIGWRSWRKMRSARMPIGDIAYCYRTPTKTMWRGGVMRAGLNGLMIHLAGTAYSNLPPQNPATKVRRNAGRQDAGPASSGRA